jgi:hypothetical protein
MGVQPGSTTYVARQGAPEPTSPRLGLPEHGLRLGGMGKRISQIESVTHGSRVSLRVSGPLRRLRESFATVGLQGWLNTNREAVRDIDDMSLEGIT